MFQAKFLQQSAADPTDAALSTVELSPSHHQITINCERSDLERERHPTLCRVIVRHEDGRIATAFLSGSVQDNGRIRFELEVVGKDAKNTERTIVSQWRTPNRVGE